MYSREKWERWQRAGDVLNLVAFLVLVGALVWAMARFDHRAGELVAVRQTPMPVVVVTPGPR